MREIDYTDIEKLLEYTCKNKATDLLISVGTKPTIRVSTILEPVQGSSAQTIDSSEKMVQTLLDEKKKQRLENDGEVDFSFSRSGLGRFRVNIYKQRGTYSIAIRSLPFEIPAFEELGLPDVIKTFSRRPKGLILATGSTGSGKSTTLASIIDMINNERHCHVITIEDPIEYLHRHKNSIVDQREVGSDTRSFASAVRSALREDPDVIMVGEMRDPETISVALTAAETGHLVFSTLHTVGAAKTIDRIIDAFPPAQQNQIKSQFATVIEGIISQQLIPLRKNKGLVAACEVMVANAAIRNLIREGKPYQINSIIQTGANLGMQSLEANLASLCASGEITQDDAVIRAMDTQLFFQLMNKRW